MKNPITAWRAFLDRHPFAKEMGWGFFEFVFTFLIFSFFTIAIHEWLHLSVTQYFGGDGYIIKTWYGAGVVWTIRPEYPQLVAFAGGIGVAIFYSFLAFMDWHDDIEQAAALLPIIGAQLAYGIVEGFFILDMPASTFRHYAYQALTVGWIVGFLAALIIMVMWLVRLDNKYRKTR